MNIWMYILNFIAQWNQNEIEHFSLSVLYSLLCLIKLVWNKWDPMIWAFCHLK